MELETFRKKSEEARSLELDKFENIQLNILKEALQECFNVVIIKIG